jgi:post-segregation antitoxin (ccd killing protein)
VDDPSKVTVEIAVDRDLAEAAQGAGLDLGEVAETALRRRFGQPAEDIGRDAERAERLRREIAAEIAWRNEIVDREGLFGEEWRTF